MSTYLYGARLINENQIAYLSNRFISEGGRLISDIVEITDILQIESILLTTVVVEKAFDYVNHLFLVSALEKYGFKNDLIRWIKLLKNPESCIINGEKTTNYFKLERGARQEDLLSAYLFILIFIKIKWNPNIKSLNVCNNEKSAAEVLNNFYIMSQFSGLKISKSKYKVAEIGVMKGIKVSLCHFIKILGIYFSYSKKLENEKILVDHNEISKINKYIENAKSVFSWENNNL